MIGLKISMINWILRNYMGIKIVYLIGISMLIMVSSLIADAAKDNNNANAVPEIISSRNLSQGTMPMNASFLNGTAANASAKESIGMANKTAFKVGGGIRDNKSAFKMDTTSKPRKNASKMWYLIQGVPHGYT
jgi:hypothetical protein